MEFGARLDGWLKAQGKTRGELAEYCEVTYSAVSYWVAHGDRKHIPPSNRNRPKILEFLGVTEAEFYGPIPKAKKPPKAKHQAAA